MSALKRKERKNNEELGELDMCMCCVVPRSLFLLRYMKYIYIYIYWPFQRSFYSLIYLGMPVLLL